MPSPVSSTATLLKLLRRLRRDQKGSAAVQFAIIGPMFFALIFAIIETSMVFFAGQVLETGTQDSARMLFTHQAQDASWTQAQFKQDLCNRVQILLSCSNVYVDVQSYAPGTTITFTDPIDGSGNFVSNFVYQPPASGSTNTVVVRAFYQWPLFVTQLGYNLANIGRNTTNSKKLLAATAAFRVEP